MVIAEFKTFVFERVSRFVASRERDFRSNSEAVVKNIITNPLNHRENVIYSYEIWQSEWRSLRTGTVSSPVGTSENSLKLFNMYSSARPTAAQLTSSKGSENLCNKCTVLNKTLYRFNLTILTRLNFSTLHL